MRTIDLRIFDEFHQGQMVGILRGAGALIASVCEFEFGATTSEKEELSKAIEIIDKIVYRYGQEDK